MGRITGCLPSTGRMWYSTSSVRSRYCGHSFSLELTAVTPAEAKMLPSPVKPLSLAPQGTASIFSSMPLSAPRFFLSAPLEEGTIRTSSMAVNTEIFMLITTSDRGSPLLYLFRSQPEPQLEIRGAGAGLRAARGLEVLIELPFAGRRASVPLSASIRPAGGWVLAGAAALYCSAALPH